MKGKNIFQIYEETKEVLPLFVKKDYWEDTNYILVTRVEIKDFTFGKAWGYHHFGDRSYYGEVKKPNFNNWVLHPFHL